MIGCDASTLMANVIVEYREPGAERWLRCIAAPGETYDEAEASLKRMWPTIETRRHVALCPHGIDLWLACKPCGRELEAKDKVLG